MCYEKHINKQKLTRATKVKQVEILTPETMLEWIVCIGKQIG